MSVYRIIVCDVCDKEERLDNPYRRKWFIENIVHSICSRKCFNKHQNKEKRGNNGISKTLQTNCKK